MLSIEKNIDVSSSRRYYGSDVVVLVHGWPDDHQVFASQIESLSKEGFKCHAFDLPGYISIPESKKWGYSFEEVVESLRKEVEKVNNGNPVHLVMHDWGVVYGLLFEEKYPHLVNRCIALDVGGAILPNLKSVFIILLYQSIIIWMFLIGGKIGSYIVTKLGQVLGAPNFSTPIQACKGYPYFWFYLERLSNKGIRIVEKPTVTYKGWHMPNKPLLFIYGCSGAKHLTMFHTKKWELAVSNKKDSYVVELQDAGHWLQVTHADRVNPLISAFLLNDQDGLRLLKLESKLYKKPTL